ncbi:MAG: hypothetical protein A2289_26780 [Deltaproteobacteria bacterium RIFOXYA12_FULL_58_15]|nr:MAG: hypothetical protein A2289_26780 [Deltaproteobacteria bacterium RIFOXYA12_FULL_58_15]OGR08271.1 MAG: hypothetical protein A2341_20180 [Deltaproteobacteria bacterium RIFOXYB12_FULL_58_9]
MRLTKTLLVTSCVVGLVAVAARAQSYIGAERCKTCHEWEYKQWAQGPHAEAHKSLSQEQRGDAKCNTCHSTLPEETDKRFAGVQCERCHGPGRYYHRRYVMRDRELARAVGLTDPKAAHCMQCHTEGTPSIEPFDFEKMWPRISHGKEARATKGPTKSPETP